MKLKEIRTDRKMSQEDLAEQSGVSRVSIARYESEDRVPSIEIARKLADALECTLDDLMPSN